MNKKFQFSLTVLKRPVILRAMRFSLNDRKFETEYRQNGFHALHLYFYNGVIRTDRGDVAIHPGDVTLTPAGFSTRYALEEKGTHLCIHFQYDSAQESSLTPTLPFYFPSQSLPHEIVYEFQQLIRYHAEADLSEYKSAAECALQLLLFRLFYSLHHQENPNQTKLSRVVAELNDHLERLTRVSELARKMEWSQTHLGRVFKSTYGCTIPQYVMRRRIEKAEILLKNSDLSIKEIGMQVGYHSAQEFFKRFRQITGQSPSAWRSCQMEK